MAHHQHHGPDYDAQMSRSLQSRPVSTSASSMPIISEDEALAEVDEPPDQQPTLTFVKHTWPLHIRRHSLLTKALHTDSESHDEEHDPAHGFNNAKFPSVASTASTQSVYSAGDFTSDDGHISPSTRASTPGSPRSSIAVPKLQLPQRQNSLLSSTDSHHESDQLHSDEASVEAKLGRKRCIMFSCGSKKEDVKQAAEESKPTVEVKAEPAKRPCMIKFACPFKENKANKDKLEEPSRTTTRRLSPAPPPKSIGGTFGRRHRDSDVTIRNASPATPKAPSSPMSPSRSKHRRFSSNSDIRASEVSRFHEFAASEEDEREDWVEESTVYKDRLTVDDTLKKELALRKLAEECDEEDALERELGEDALDDDEDDEDDDEDALSDYSIDSGHQTDDEEGFAESDDDEDDNSDYEWWAPRRTAAASPYVGRNAFRPTSTRNYSDSSLGSSDGAMSAERRSRPTRKRSMPMTIRRSPSPDLPDSTDFVCGTLDEDRPQETAYMAALANGHHGRHRIRPQDIDPSFPLEEPGSSDDEPETPSVRKHDESDHFMHGPPSDIGDELRGRRLHELPVRSSHESSPKRLRSPPPPAKKSCAKHRSPAPHMLFGGNRNRRLRSPGPPERMTSPPPSRRGSRTASPNAPTTFGVAFLSTRSGNLTHTASLPRSPHPTFRRGRTPAPARRSSQSDQEEDEDEDEEATATDRPNDTRRYLRGAIDIAQGLERKRLKRREMYCRHHARKEEKRERKCGKKRPVPGRGAERMRRECLGEAAYKSTRMLSV